MCITTLIGVRELISKLWLPMSRMPTSRWIRLDSSWLNHRPHLPPYSDLDPNLNKHCRRYVSNSYMTNPFVFQYHSCVTLFDLDFLMNHSIRWSHIFKSTTVKEQQRTSAWVFHLADEILHGSSNVDVNSAQVGHGQSARKPGGFTVSSSKWLFFSMRLSGFRVVSVIRPYRCSLDCTVLR